MSARTYLSIGDVLTLLREEFPDVTISKIRFLESQGLVNPERSPSGYRKFFDHDVERLRWVLRQQREHFLPLKVIRDRLAGGELDDLPADRHNGKPAEQSGAHAATAAAPEDEQPTKADEEAMARILADASRRAAARVPEAAQARRGLQVVGEDTAGSLAPPAVTSNAAASASAAVPPADASVTAPKHAARRLDAAPAEDSGARTNGVTTKAEPEPPARRGASTTETMAPPAPAAAPASSAPSATPRAGGEATAAATAAMVTGASLTAQELCAASGLSPEEVSALEGFGLICSVRVAGLQTYDEEALAVANLAAAFRVYGIEARHLRLYRNAVDREMGLIEQVVIPLLRQRNPESRQRAVEGADQLASLGQSMRASLLRQALRQHLGG